jgi:3',5'-cyclic AMP phosphodiesterase CpdA
MGVMSSAPSARKSTRVSNDGGLTRREALRGLFAGAGCGAVLSAGCGPAPAGAEADRPDFTAAFFTDLHVWDKQGAADGCGRAVRHAMAQPRAPELVLTGGDLAFDIMYAGPGQADAQYAVFDAIWNGVRAPVHHVVGNHDCLGVAEESGVDPGDHLYGKAYFRRRFGLDRTYHSFDHEGWHFVMLDTVEITGRRYRGWVDEEQLAWLADDLAAAGRPTVVVGHIPLFSNFTAWRRGTERPIPDGASVVNAHEVARVLVEHPVRLVLGGHLHINESIRFKGIEFANVGAVSGRWWRGARDGFEEGYAMLEFRGDTVTWRYVDYGWEAHPESALVVEGPEFGIQWG